MAQNTPCDPEKGIIDLFDIVDDPEASPQPEPCGALYDAGEAAAPEPPDGEANTGHLMSRYPFENGVDFQRERGEAPSGEAPARPADEPPGATPSAVEALGEPVCETTCETSGEDLIRAFEEEMAKAGAVVSDGDAP